MKGTFEIIHIGRLALNDYNVRRFEENMTPQRQARFNELVASVRTVGILEPLVVRPLQDGTINFEIIAGERRFRAAMEAQLTDIPCMVREVSDAEAFDLMVIENLQRDDLTPFETATAFRAYLDKHGNNHDAACDLSARTGIPVHGIRRMVRLLDLPADVLKAWRDGALSQSHAELFTRVNDQAQAAELLAACLRMKLSTRELAERIGAAAVDLERGFFDKAECQTCPDNTSVQSGLFCDLTPSGKCGNPGCFEQKQGAFLTENWKQSKAAEMFGTNGFRFGHRLGVDHRELADRQEAGERCRTCGAFISVLRLTGAVVSGYSRSCVGPLACFEEIYIKPPAAAGDDEERAEGPAPEASALEQSLAGTRDKKQEQKKAAPPAVPAKPQQQPPKPAAPAEPTGPVFDSARGERARKAFIKDRLMNTGSQVLSYRLGLLGLAMASTPAKSFLSDLLGLGPSDKPGKLAEAIFEVPAEEINVVLRQAAAAHIMADFALSADVWQMAAERFGIDIPRDWALNETYLASLTKSEIVRIGEELGVGIWTDAAAEAYRQEHYKGKALLALKKEELIDIIIKSGAELAGRVPAEVVGKKRG